MKTKLFLIALPLMFLYGCTKDKSNFVSTALDHQQIEKSTMVMRMNLVNPNPSVESYSLDALHKLTSAQVNSRTSENHSANGHFTPIEDYPGTFSSTLNNGGTHGSAIIRLPWAGLHLDIECLTVENNVAVIEGQIKQVFYDYCDGCMMVGQYFSFEVIDNGEGQNAPSDQVGSYIFWSDEPLCGAIPPNSPDWGPLLDVVGQGDQIQVK